MMAHISVLFCEVYLTLGLYTHTQMNATQVHAFSSTVCAQPLREADVSFLALIQDQETLMWI